MKLKYEKAKASKEHCVNKYSTTDDPLEKTKVERPLKAWELLYKIVAILSFSKVYNPMNYEIQTTTCQD